ncbi:MAG: hypothetical protein H7296_12405 [Bacteroidia bacterium]|nr:hypothetical protein [Bacteroidia bacterium]
MKKIITILFFAIAVLNTKAIAANQSKPLSITCNNEKQVLEKAEFSLLNTRLQEIRNMDLKNTTITERKQLNKEVLEIKERFNGPLGGGVYISAGALIIIIILLIIIL